MSVSPVPGVHRHTLPFGGAAQQVLVAAPADPPRAIVLSLHGSTSHPSDQVRLSRMAKLAQLGALVAFPRGSRPARAGWEWNLEGDVDFLDALVDDLAQRYGAGTVPLCVSGMSGGARLASRYAAVGRHRTELLGAVAGLRAPAAPRSAHPVRVVAFHGTKDRINPYGGGSTARWDESVLDAARAWAEHNGHGGEPERTEVTDHLTRLSWGPDSDPGHVALWVSEGAGHTWPGTRLNLGLRLFLGRVEHGVDATAEIWTALDHLAGPGAAAGGAI